VFANESRVLLGECFQFIESTALEFLECDIFIDWQIVVLFANGTKFTRTKLLWRQFWALIALSIATRSRAIAIATARTRPAVSVTRRATIG
jgi:hypothetical protein